MDNAGCVGVTVLTEQLDDAVTGHLEAASSGQPPSHGHKLCAPAFAEGHNQAPT